MFKRIISVTALLAVALLAVPSANAEDDAAKINNRKHVIHSCLLHIYTTQKKRPQALAEYQIMVGMTPNDAKLRFSYGVFILQGGTPADFNAALVQLKKAVELDPGNFEIYGTIGSLYLKLKNPDEALIWFGKAIQYGGGEKYKKSWQDVQVYLQQKKQADLQRKKILEQQKLQAAQKKKQAAEGTSKSGSDDDDDW
ncbi:MAG: hypothetical protein SGJ27_24235 [Candidatus Melainabacteria bacterium]|nr:hypothetical protein [Candidatus Melainabacteria bacterium]